MDLTWDMCPSFLYRLDLDILMSHDALNFDSRNFVKPRTWFGLYVRGRTNMWGL